MDPTASASRHLCQNAVAWRNQAEKPRVHSVPLMQGWGYARPMDEFDGKMFGHCFACKTAEKKDVYKSYYFVILW